MGVITSLYRGGNWDSERLSGFHKPRSGTGTFLLAAERRCHPWSLPRQTRNFQEEFGFPLSARGGFLEELGY